MVGNPRMSISIECKALRAIHPCSSCRCILRNKIILAENRIGVGSIGFRGSVVESEDSVVSGIGRPQITGRINDYVAGERHFTLGRYRCSRGEIGLTQHAICIGSNALRRGIVEAEHAMVTGICYPKCSAAVDCQSYWIRKSTPRYCKGRSSEIRLSEN